MLRSVQALAVGLSVAFFAVAASAAPIYMSPDPVALPSVLGVADSFELTLVNGDTTTNRLDFALTGPGGLGFFPAAGAHAIHFDDVTVVDSGNADPGFPNVFLSDLGGLFGDPSLAGWLALDFGGPTAFEFWVEMSGLPTTAMIYSLNIELAELQSKDDFFENIIQRDHVTFSTPVPEPSAALVFGMGVLVARRAVRSRRA